MTDYKCIEISFLGVDFDEDYSNSVKPTSNFHAHLYTEDETIELKIFFEPKINFRYKFSLWLSKKSWTNFGSYINVSKENQNYRVEKIDFTNSSILGMTSSHSQVESDLEYISIQLDSIKIYYIPNEENINTGEFYFDNAGFVVVKDFYAPMFGWNETFKMNRMDGRDIFYKIEKAEFRPEFNFSYQENAKGSNEINIIKEPKIEFHYKENISEAEALKYGEVVCSLSSFYFHRKIGFTLIRIRLANHTIVIKKNIKSINFETSYGFRWLSKPLDFHTFLQTNWQEKTLQNFEKISKVIAMFNQSNIVDSSSRFLIRYNIIEICNNLSKHSGEYFKLILDKKNCKKKYEQALEMLLETVAIEDHIEFKKKWISLSGNLSKRLIESPLLTFFEKENLDPTKFSIQANDLKKLRDKITHGSIDNIDNELLKKANNLLYTITGKVILNLICRDINI